MKHGIQSSNRSPVFGNRTAWLNLLTAACLCTPGCAGKTGPRADGDGSVGDGAVKVDASDPDKDDDGDGFTENQGDCDDSNPDVYPGAVEVCTDGVDNNCDGLTDGEDRRDGDSDGWGPCQGDCDDDDPEVYPGAQEIEGNGIDDNCDGFTDEDIDGDGFTEAAGDCDDRDPDVNPDAFEECGDGIDNDCDGLTDQNCTSPCEAAVAARSSVGCVFYAVDTNTQLDPGLYAVAVSNIHNFQTANVVIEVHNGSNWSPVAGGSFSVPPLDLHWMALAFRSILGSGIHSRGAYRITSDLPVIAYQFNPMDGSLSYLSDASLLLPVSSFDTQYVVPAWPFGPRDQETLGTPANIQIVASEATEVRVVSPITTAPGSIPAQQPGVQASYNLQEGDVLQLTVYYHMDSFTGTTVDADAPVGVFSSNDCVNVPADPAYCCCEHLEEQVFGLQTWGNQYVAARVVQRGAEPAIWQILAAENNTVVQFASSGQVTGLPGSVTLDAGQYVEYQVNGPSNQPGDFFVDANKPVLVTQFMVGAWMVQPNAYEGDPSMVQAVPVEQYLDRYVVLVPDTWVNDYLVLVRAQGALVQIDAGPISANWIPVGSSGYEVARVSVADGVHVLSGVQPFGVIVMGYDSYDSYAYPGGLNQTLINPTTN